MVQNHSELRAGFPKQSFFFAIVILLLAVVPLFFLNQCVLAKLKNDFPFKWQGYLTSQLPGDLSLKDFHVKEKSVFDGHSSFLKVKYQPLEFVFKRKVSLNVTAEDVSLHLKDVLFNQKLSDFHFDALEALLSVDIHGKIRINYFFARSQDLIVYIGGFLERDKLDVAVSCFLTSKLVHKLPEFISEHLFFERENLLKQIQFKAKGTWDHPYFYLSSDLMHVEMKPREV